jgi:NAD(P)-dependent dehydrogenase (short-subunit alcohol dehydrogenase family)
MTEIPTVSRTAVVTGANSGIGKEVARRLIGAGFTVHVGSRNRERGLRAIEEIGCGAQLMMIDVTNLDSVGEAAERVGALDVLINNAGIMVDSKPPQEADLGSFRATYETNVFGVVAVTNAFLPSLSRSLHPRVVNISSGTGSLSWSTGPNPQFDFDTRGAAAAYRSSKAALNALTVYYAQALADRGIKVNALAPGLRSTNLNARASASNGDPAEAAAAVVRLALIDDDGPTGMFFSWDGSVAPW